MLVPSSAPAQEPGLDAGPLLSSCPLTLLEQVPRVLPWAHRVGEHKTRGRFLLSSLLQPGRTSAHNQHCSLHGSPLIFPPNPKAHVLTCLHSC